MSSQRQGEKCNYCTSGTSNKMLQSGAHLFSVPDSRFFFQETPFHSACTSVSHVFLPNSQHSIAPEHVQTSLSFFAEQLVRLDYSTHKKNLLFCKLWGFPDYADISLLIEVGVILATQENSTQRKEFAISVVPINHV